MVPQDFSGIGHATPERSALHRHVAGGHEIPHAPEFSHFVGSAERDADVLLHRGDRRGGGEGPFFLMREKVTLRAEGILGERKWGWKDWGEPCGGRLVSGILP